MKKGTSSITRIGLLIAMSVIGKFLSVTLGPFRFGTENLPILLSGIMLGPTAGAVTGGLSDILGCLLVGYPINPIITIGATSIGCICGFLYKEKCWIFRSILIAHIVGSVIIKSIGLFIYYAYPISLLMFRVIEYLITATIEWVLVKELISRFKNNLS